MMQALDGTISAADSARLSAYLNAHPDEREVFEQMLRFESRFEASLEVEPVTMPANFMMNVMTQVHQVAIARPFAITAMSGKQIALIILIFSSAIAAAFAVGGGLLAYGSSFAGPNLGPAGAVARSFWITTQAVLRVAINMGRVVLMQPLTWAVIIAGAIAIAAWMKLIVPAWVPQRELA